MAVYVGLEVRGVKKDAPAYPDARDVISMLIERLDTDVEDSCRNSDIDEVGHAIFDSRVVFHVGI